MEFTISGGMVRLELELYSPSGSLLAEKIVSGRTQGLGGAVEPQEVVFKSAEDNYQYIFVDHPEHIRKVDTLENQSLLMHVNNLETGKRYVLAEYHHKSTNDAFGGNPFSVSDALYYDAAFCGNEGTAVTIHRIGYSHSQTTGVTEWNQLTNAYTDFIGMGHQNKTSSHGYAVGEHTFPSPKTDDAKGIIWFSDMINSDDSNKMLISPSGSNMGYVHVLVEFEVSAPAALRTMAYTDKAQYKDNFKSYMQSSYEDLPDVVLKGVGDFSQTIETEILDYEIDDSLFANGTLSLPFKVNNKLSSDSIVEQLFTNTVPTFYDAKRSVPESAVFSITYTGQLKDENGNSEEGKMIFDGYHNPKISEFNIADLFKLGRNEEYPQELLEWVINNGDAPETGEASKAVNLLSGSGNMFGYDVTHKYNIRIKNGGSQIRYLSYKYYGKY